MVFQTGEQQVKTGRDETHWIQERREAERGKKKCRVIVCTPKGSDPGPRQTEFWSQWHHFLTVWPQATCLTSLCLCHYCEIQPRYADMTLPHKVTGTSYERMWAKLPAHWNLAINEDSLLFPFYQGCFSEKTMAPPSSTLAWKIPWREEPGKLQSMGLQRVGHN